METDCYMAPMIDAVWQLVRDGEILKAVDLSAVPSVMYTSETVSASSIMRSGTCVPFSVWMCVCLRRLYLFVCICAQLCVCAYVYVYVGGHVYFCFACLHMLCTCVYVCFACECMFVLHVGVCLFCMWAHVCVWCALMCVFACLRRRQSGVAWRICHQFSHRSI